MNIQVISPISTIIYEDIEKLSIPTEEGIIQILNGHSETFLILKKGKIILENDIIKKELEVNGGEVYCNKNIIKIIF